MKTTRIIIIGLSFLFLLNACEQSASDKTYLEETASEFYDLNENQEAAEVPLSSTAAIYEDDKRKLVRKADISMEVKDVYNSTTAIERKLAEMGGFVLESGLRNKILRKETFPISSDSAMEVKRYQAVNDMTLRMPYGELGQFLTALGEEMEFLDYRNISVDDVSLNLMLSQLERERLQKTNFKLDGLNKESGKIKDKKEVINSANHNMSEENQRVVSEERLLDEVAFSTVSLRITEKEKLTETMVINTAEYAEKYHPGFLSQAGTALSGGWELFQWLITAILYLWPLWIVAIFIFGIYRSRIQQKNIKTTP